MLGKNPGCWVNYGIPMLLSLFLALLVVGWYVEYPDVVPVPVTITSQNPPIRVLARSAGKLSRLAVREGETVQAGQVLAELESGARGADVAALSQFLEKLERGNTPEGFALQPAPQGLQLGPLQNSFAALLNSQQILLGQLQQDFVFRQIGSLENEIQETRQLIESLERQTDILRQDFALAEKDQERQRGLLSEGLISAQDFEKSNSAYLRQKQQLESFVANISAQRVKIRQLESQQSQLGQGRRQEVQTRWEALRQIGLNLRGEINQWELLYLVKAPLAGQVVLSQRLVEQQFVRPEEELFSIVSPGAGARIMALGLLPQANSGKVAAGQTVKIRLDGYPYQEFGVLEGHIVSIASVPTGNNYQVQIELPQDLQTSARKTIPYRPDARGVGNIITKKRTLLQRMFDQILSLRS